MEEEEKQQPGLNLERKSRIRNNVAPYPTLQGPCPDLL
jgi:hypothetical protein